MQYHNALLLLFIVLIILFINDFSIKEHFVNIKKHIFNKKKIAFIFLSIGDVNQYKIWERFFKGNEDKYNIYIHPKFPNRVRSFFKNHIIDNIIETKWGDVSLVNATNIMIKKALEDASNKKIILVSDSCIPIKKFDFIYKSVLQDNKSWFNYYKPNHTQGSKDHLRRIDLLNHVLKRNSYINEQWMILDRNHARLLNKNNKLIQFFKTPYLIPDEIYYITVLHYLNKNIKNELKFPINDRKNYLKHNYITYAKWYDPRIKRWQMKHPFEYNVMDKYDIIMMKNSQALFARKFSSESNINKYWKYIVS